MPSSLIWVVAPVRPATPKVAARIRPAEVTVVPVANERALRNLAWVDANRRAVDRMTGGRVAYVYLPDTAAQGYTRFNRYFFAQAGRDGVIVDERFNGGGLLADHVVDYLRQPVRNYATTRDGADQQSPTSAIPGPKVMLINEQAGSGGDYLPYAFRQAGLGKLIGKRTWGGLVGIGGYPPLIDGGMVTAPRTCGISRRSISISRSPKIVSRCLPVLVSFVRNTNFKLSQSNCSKLRFSFSESGMLRTVT